MDIVSEINSFYYHMALHELQLMNGSDCFHGLSYNSILYINVIAQTRDCTVSRIADMLHVTKSAVTIKINELTKQGAVVRIRSDKDRRVFFIRLSLQMEKTMSMYDEIFEKAENNLRKKFTEEQLEVFGEILHTISGYEWRKTQNE